MFCVQVLKHLDLLYTWQCCFISVLFTADIISTVEFNYSGDLLATGDKGGRVVIFQREQEVSDLKNKSALTTLVLSCTVSLHLFIPWGLNGQIVFSETPKLTKFLNICLVLNLMSLFGGSPLTFKKWKVTNIRWIVHVCTCCAQYHFADFLLSFALGQVGRRRIVMFLKIMSEKIIKRDTCSTSRTTG